MMAKLRGKRVLVTGGTGFIASHIIQQLFQHGARVRATVRDVSSPNVAFIQE